MTGAQRQHCGVARAAELLAERWTLLIVRDLLIGPQRYGEILAGLPGLSTNILATRLRSLDDGGVVQRALLPRPRSGTVYELTAYGRELEDAVLALARWGLKSLGEPQEGAPARPVVASLTLRERLGGLAGLIDGGPTRIVVDYGSDVVTFVCGPDRVTTHWGGEEGAHLVVSAGMQTILAALHGRLDPRRARDEGTLTLRAAGPGLEDAFLAALVGGPVRGAGAP